MGSLLSIGFRPFYVAAAVVGALAVPAWYAVYLGWLPPGSFLPPMAWHGHEMIFGFAPAVIVGFLLTAVRAWTGHPTPAGSSLLALVALWLTGRVLLLTGPATLAVVVDGLFLPVVAAVLAVPLWRARNQRNAFVVPLLALLGALSFAHHAAFAGWLDPAWGRRAPTAALDLIALLLAVIGGRVIPSFSANAVPGLEPRRWPALEAFAIGTLVAILLADLTGAGSAWPDWLLRGLFLAAAAAHAVRLAGWKPWQTRGNLLLAALPLGYLWLPIHLLLRGLLDDGAGHMGPLALHALTVGAMAGLMLAMMTRSALGHTGRGLVAGRAEAYMFGAIHLAAVLRVLAPLVWPQQYVVWVGLSALCWTVAFAAFAAVYLPRVTSPRADAS